MRTELFYVRVKRRTQNVMLNDSGNKVKKQIMGRIPVAIFKNRFVFK